MFKRIKQFFARIFGGGEVSAMASPPLISPDFSQEYVPFRAEDGKFVVADTDHDTFSDYPSTGDGKYVMLTYSINDYNMLDFTEPYVPFRAEDGKFVKLNVPESLGYPLSGAGKYAVLTYNVNPPGLSGGEVGGDLTIIGGLSTDCGNDAEWCSTYTTVCANSAGWEAAAAEGILTINSQTGPAITIAEAGIIDVNTTTNTITISARQLSAGDIFDFDTAVCSNSCVSSLSLSSDYWNSTYTTVSANSATWADHITAINSQTGPSIVINEAGIIDVNTTANTITISARQLSAGDIFAFDTAVCSNSCVSSLSLSSDYWNSTYTTVSTNSASWDGDFCNEIVLLNNVSACSGIIDLSGSLNITGNITATNISAVNLSVVNLFTPGSAVTIDTSVIVASSLSAKNIYTDYIATSCGDSTEWCSVYSTVCGNSGLWDSTYTTVCSESAANWQNRNLYGFIQTETGTLTADIQADTFILSSLTSGVDVHAAQPDIVTFSVDLSTNQIWHDNDNTPFLSGVSGLDDVIDDIYTRLSGQELVIINNSYVQDQGAVANPYVTQPAGTNDPTLADTIINFISWQGTALFGKEPYKLVSINSTTAPQGTNSAVGAMRLEDHSNGVVLASSMVFTTNGLDDTQIQQWTQLTAFPVNETDLALKLWTPSGPNNREAGCSNFQIIV